jgi:PAS domain S-box-containing protein
MTKQCTEILRKQRRDLAQAVARELERSEDVCAGLSLEALVSAARMSLDNILDALAAEQALSSTWVDELCALLVNEGWRLGDLVAFVGALRRRLVDASLAAMHDEVDGAEDTLFTVMRLCDAIELVGVDGFHPEAGDEREHLQLAWNLLESAVDGAGMADLDGNFVFANSALCSMLGRESLEGVPLTDVFENGAVQPDATTREVLVQGQWDGVLPFKRRDGSTFQGRLTVFPVHDESGKISGTAALVRDVTEERELERLLQLVIDHFPAIVYVKGLDDRYIVVNQFAAQVMGLQPEEIVGKADDELFPPAVVEEFRSREAEVAEAGAPISFTDSFEEADGSHTYLGTLVPLLDTAGELFAYGGISTDITELKRSEAERARLQEELLSAHKEALRELSTPIIPITDQLVVMPLIGPIDSGRAKDVHRKLVEGIVEFQATHAILDLTGVSVVDTVVASSLIKVVQSARLLGAEVLLTGIKPRVAQVMVQLGVDLKGTATHGSLKSGIAHATRSMTDG